MAGPSWRWSATATYEMRSGILYATAIIILVFLPLFALSGIEGRLFAPLGIAFIVSILASLAVAVTVTPVLSYWLLPRMRHLAERESPLVRVLKRWQKARPRVVLRPAGVRHRLAHRRGCRRRILRHAAAARLPAVVQRRHGAGQRHPATRHQPHRKRPHRPHRREDRRWRCRRCTRSAAERAAPSSTSTPRASTTASSMSISSGRRARREAVLADIRQRLIGAARQHHRRPADRASARSHAVGRACPARAQDLRRRFRCAAGAGGRLRAAAEGHSRHRRSADREAGAHSAASGARRTTTRRCVTA